MSEYKNYPLPNDDRERARLHRQHEAIVALMHQKPVHAPVGNKEVKKILDIGCGVNADMTIYLGKLFPQAQVYGVDMSQVLLPSDVIPNNVEFIRGNVTNLITSDGRLEAGTFDYVYSRLIVGAMGDWETWITDIVAPLLAPGGWIEVHDQDHLDWYDEKDMLISQNWPWVEQFGRFWTETRGNKFNQLRDHFEEICDKASLAKAERKTYRLPYAPVSGQPETELYGIYASEVADVFNNAICSVFAGDENAKVRDELSRNCKDTLQSRPGMWTPFFACWAKKPYCSLESPP